ncbi:hypothetical protein NA647_14940 [Pseudomonas stutzeri]|uniref:hypothetical protein n=1 Tax=Stutzerimonas stutzeri TaxID=316 RepID=UPI00210DDFA9|nr:hypothetical protein [Stutzerimonas stutzeri]MCQ4288727.1 hypothetical protein [Stutzerimonas stutzeri]
MLEAIIEHSSMLVAILALIASLAANSTAHKAHRLNEKSAASAARLLVLERKRELLMELDRQRATLDRLKFVMECEEVIISSNPLLQKIIPDELDRLANNISMVNHFLSAYDSQRTAIELLSEESDAGELDMKLADLRRLTVHFEKDIEQEKSLLEQRKSLERGE